jgi:hypothetical protein
VHLIEETDAGLRLPRPDRGRFEDVTEGGRGVEAGVLEIAAEQVMRWQAEVEEVVGSLAEERCLSGLARSHQDDRSPGDILEAVNDAIELPATDGQVSRHPRRGVPPPRILGGQDCEVVVSHKAIIATFA